MALSEQRKKELDAIAQKRGLAPIEQPQDRGSILGGIARDLATPFARAGVNAYNLIGSVGNLGAAGIAKVAGKDDMARNLVRDAGREATKVRNVPFLGETSPVMFGDSGDILKDAKDVVGTGLQIGTTVAGGGATGGLAKTGLRTALKQGAKEGTKLGASTGAGYEAGRALSDDKDALEVLQSFLVGGVGGGILGAGVGATLPVLGAGARAGSDVARSTYRAGREFAEEATQKVRNIRNPLAQEGDSGIVGGIVENVRNTANKVKGSVERSKINVQAQREAREAFEQLAPESQDAIRKGLLPRDVELVKAGTEAEKGVFKRLTQAAKGYEENRATTNRPSMILGEEFSKRINGLGRALDSEVQNLDEIVTGLGAGQLDSSQTVNTVLERMGSASGLRGLNVKPGGQLDFTGTQLSGANSAAARKELQKIFDDVVQRADNPERLHLYRKELFEDLGGKKSSGLKLTGTEEKAVNAMRQGMADAIDTVAPGYKETNTKVATLLDNKKQIAKKFGEVSEGNEDIFNVKSSILLRRLTSNAKTGQDMAELIQDLEKILGDYGVRFDTDLIRIQEFLNLLDRYYDIAPDTSLLGITRTSLPRGKAEILDRIVDIVGSNFKATDETAKQAIEDLLSQ